MTVNMARNFFDAVSVKVNNREKRILLFCFRFLVVVVAVDFLSHDVVAWVFFYFIFTVATEGHFWPEWLRFYVRLYFCCFRIILAYFIILIFFSIFRCSFCLLPIASYDAWQRPVWLQPLFCFFSGFYFDFGRLC